MKNLFDVQTNGTCPFAGQVPCFLGSRWESHEYLRNV